MGELNSALTAAALVLGVAALVSSIAHSCPADSRDGGGELHVERPFDISVLAPVLMNAGRQIPLDGIASAPLVVAGGCGVMIDCAPCPPRALHAWLQRLNARRCNPGDQSSRD